MEGGGQWGRVEFTFNSVFDEFTGKWGYCEADPTKDWNGAKKAP